MTSNNNNTIKTSQAAMAKNASLIVGTIGVIAIVQLIKMYYNIYTITIWRNNNITILRSYIRSKKEINHNVAWDLQMINVVLGHDTVKTSVPVQVYVKYIENWYTLCDRVHKFAT